MKPLFSLLLFFAFTTAYPSAEPELSAEQIIDDCIKYSGGMEKLEEVTSITLSYVVLREEGHSTSLIQKRITGQKFAESVISVSGVSQGTYFNGNKLSLIQGGKPLHTEEAEKIDEMKLKTYSNIVFGYKKLGYTFERMEDTSFESGEYFVVKATSPTGYETTNFFNKLDGLLTMVVYPSGGRSVITDRTILGGVVYDASIIYASAESNEEVVMKLAKNPEINQNIRDMWFECPHQDELVLPDNIRMGTFLAIDGQMPTVFQRTEQVQDYLNEDGSFSTRKYLIWSSVDSFALMSEEDLRKSSSSKDMLIHVRITGWDGKGYSCHWLYQNYMGTQDYVIIED